MSVKLTYSEASKIFPDMRVETTPTYVINVKVKVKVTLEQAKKALRGCRCIAVLLLQPRRSGRFTPGKDPVSIV